MHIPNRIKIGGLTYTVKQVEKVSRDDNEAGLIVTEDQSIELRKGKPDFMHITLLHEIIHGINMELPEVEVEFFAQALYQVIKDNPKMFENE